MPKSKEQNEKIRKRRRDIIVSAALNVFAEKGLDNTSIDDIAKEVGCSHGLIYHYYDNKNEIFKEIINLSNHGLFELLNERLSIEGTSYDKMMNLTKGFIIAIQKNNQMLNFCRIAFEEIRRDSIMIDNYKECNEEKKMITSQLIDTITTGQENGEFVQANPMKLLRFYFAMIRDVFFQQILGVGDENHPQDANIIMNIFVK